jgi:hypothetical protein
LSYLSFLDLDNFFQSLFYEEEASSQEVACVEADFFRLYLEVDTGWPWPLDAAQRFFEDLWNAIANLPGRVWAFLNDAFKGLAEWLWNNIAWPIIQYTFDVWLITDEWTRGWSEPWKTIGRLFLFGPAFAYKGLRDFIYPALQELGKEVIRAFDGALNAVSEALYSVFKPVIDPLLGFFDAVKNFFTKDVPDFFKGALDFFASIPQRLRDFWDWLTKNFQGFIDAAYNFFTKDVPDFFAKVKDFFANLGSMLYEFFTKTLPEGFMNFLRAAYDWLSKNVGEPLMNALRGIWDTISGVFTTMFEAFLKVKAAYVEIFEREGISGVVKALMPIFAGGITMSIAVDMLSLKIIGSGIDPDAVRQFFMNLINQLFDFKLFFSVYAAIAIEKPLEHAMKRMFRTERPGVGDALNFLAKNIAKEEDVRHWLEIQGYPDEIVDVYMKSIYKEPPFGAVFTSYARGKIDESEYRAWLSILNIDKAETLHGTLYPHRILEESMWKLPSPFMLVYATETGEVSEDVLKRMLQYELYHPEFVDVITKALLWRAARDERSLLRRYAIEDYVEGVTRREELEHYLSVLGISGDLVSSLIDFLDSRRRKDIRKKALSYLERQFLEGYMSRQDFVSQLAQYGFDEELLLEYATLLEYVRDNYVVVKETKDERSATKASLVNKFKKGLLTEEQLETELRKLGLNEIEIALTVSRAKLEFEAEQVELQLSDLIEKLKQGRLSRSEFVDNATKLGIRYERAMVLADYYWTKYIGDEFYVITKDERSALASSLIKKFVLGFMSEDELKDELKKLAFTEEEISLKVRRAVVEDEVKMLSDLIAEADALLKKGEVSEEDYVAYLVSLGMREERAKARAGKILASAVKKAR